MKKRDIEHRKFITAFYLHERKKNDLKALFLKFALIKPFLVIFFITLIYKEIL